MCVVHRTFRQYRIEGRCYWHTLRQCPLRAKYKGKQFNLILKFTLSDRYLLKNLSLQPSPNYPLARILLAALVSCLVVASRGPRKFSDRKFALWERPRPLPSGSRTRTRVSGFGPQPAARGFGDGGRAACAHAL